MSFTPQGDHRANELLPMFTTLFLDLASHGIVAMTVFRNEFASPVKEFFSLHANFQDATIHTEKVTREEVELFDQPL